MRECVVRLVARQHMRLLLIDGTPSEASARHDWAARLNRARLRVYDAILTGDEADRADALRALRSVACSIMEGVMDGTIEDFFLEYHASTDESRTYQRDGARYESAPGRHSENARRVGQMFMRMFRTLEALCAAARPSGQRGILASDEALE